MQVKLTVGKVDAGVAVLLTEDKRLIEFPSILLPPDIHSGSIVDINVSRNQHAELIAEQKFSALQAEISDCFGSRSPSAPFLRCRNATQTSVVLEWDPIDLATAELRSLSLYRNGTKAGVIPRDKLSTKISGLALDMEYTFHLVLRTSAGQYTSEKLAVKTHKMTNLTGITVTPGIMPAQLKESLAETVHKIGAKIIDSVRIDTTHFVCTEPRGTAWEKALELNVPVVVPDWLIGCEREGRIVGVRGYYLDADPKLRQMGPSTTQQRGSVSTVAGREQPSFQHTPPTPDRPTRGDANDATPGTEPPTPPPKPERSRSDDRTAQKDNQSSAGTTVVAKPEDDDGDYDEDDSDDAETVPDDHERPTPEAPTQATEAPPSKGVSVEEDGKFDEVDL